jgi:hypothetical protein
VSEIDAPARRLRADLALQVAHAYVAARSGELHVVSRRNGHHEVEIEIVAPSEPARRMFVSGTYRHIVLLLVEGQIEIAEDFFRALAARSSHPSNDIDGHSRATAVDADVADVGLQRQRPSGGNVERSMNGAFDGRDCGGNSEKGDRSRQRAAKHG